MFDRQMHPSRDRSPSLATEPTSPPTWPLPALNGRAPVVLATDSKSPGIDLAYQREHPADLVDLYRIGTANGSESHFMPSSMPAFAVRDGVISHAGKQRDGFAIVVNHRNGWATYYANLEHMFVAPTNGRFRRAPRVKAGDVLGYIGAPDPGALKCLHFELWKCDVDWHFVAVDPTSEMRSWLVLPWSDDRLTPPDSIAIKAAA